PQDNVPEFLAWSNPGQVQDDWHWRRSSSTPEEALNFGEDFNEAIDFVGRVIEIKAGPSGGFYPQPTHKCLIAMVSAAQGDAAFTGHGDHVVGMHVIEDKTDQAGAANMRPKETKALESRQRGECVSAQFLIVLGDPVAPDGIQVIHGGMETDRARNIR